MKILIKLWILSVAIVVLGLGAQNAAAQPGGGGGNFGGGNFGGGNFGNGNFDPQQIQQQIQQRLLDNLRQQLEITNDAEWGAVEPLILKVGQDWISSMTGGLGGLGNMFGNRGGGGRGGQGARNCRPSWRPATRSGCGCAAKCH